MKKTNRFALLALVSGILASALVMGCGGGGETTEGTATDSTNAVGNTSMGNATTGNATTGNAAQ